MRSIKFYLSLVMFILAALLLAACGGSTASEAAPAEEAAAAEEAAPAEEAAADDSSGSKGTIIAFTPARSERYVNGLIQGLSQEAERAGYEITILENEFNQAQQDEQVQQQLAIGAEPDIWIWWPAEGAAGLGSLRDLHATGIPVLQINQLPSEDAEPFVVAYAGPDDALRARNAGEMLVEVREKWIEAGKELSSDGGNAIGVTYPIAYGGYPLSINAFMEGIDGSGIAFIGESNEGFGSQNGYNGAASLIAQVQDQGIDFIYGMDDAILQGAIQALEEAGFTVGVPKDGAEVDIVAVGTVCNGDRQLLEEQRQYGTTLQAPLLEGQLAIQVADEYLTTGSVENFLNFTPNPKVRYNEWQDFTLEGFDGNTYTMDSLCTWGSSGADAEPVEEEEGAAAEEAMEEEEAAVEPGSKGTIIAFTPARSERYVNGLIQGLSQEAENAGYEITILENEFNQAQQDEQVQQQLAIGSEPDIWIWWPAEGAAGLGSLRDLHATGIPVLQINQLPSEDAESFVIGYAGPDDALRARNAGEMMVEAREAWVEAGKELSSEGGNAIGVTYPIAYGGYPLSINAFHSGIEGSGIEFIGESNEGFGSQNGYNGAASLIAQVQDQGIDFIYGMDDAILQGAIQALEEAGFTVGVPEDGAEADIIAVGTVCNGDRQLLEEQRQYGTTLQAPLLEGQLAIQVADEYLTNGSLENFLNFTPNPKVRYNEWQDFSLEGFDGNTYEMDSLCTWGSAN